MSSSTFGRRPFLVGSGLSLGALLTLPSLAAGAAGSKVAIPLAKLETLKSVGGSIAIKVKDKLLLLVRDSATSVRAFNPVCTTGSAWSHSTRATRRSNAPATARSSIWMGAWSTGPRRDRWKTYPAELADEQVIVTL